MQTTYFLVENNETTGPFTVAELQERGLSPDDLVCPMYGDWRAAKEIEALKGIISWVPPTPPPIVKPKEDPPTERPQPLSKAVPQPRPEDNIIPIDASPTETSDMGEPDPIEEKSPKGSLSNAWFWRLTAIGVVIFIYWWVGCGEDIPMSDLVGDTSDESSFQASNNENDTNNSTYRQDSLEKVAANNEQILINTKTELAQLEHDLEKDYELKQKIADELSELEDDFKAEQANLKDTEKFKVLRSKDEKEAELKIIRDNIAALRTKKTAKELTLDQLNRRIKSQEQRHTVLTKKKAELE